MCAGEVNTPTQAKEAWVGHPHDLKPGHPPLLDQIHHGQKCLPAPDQKAGQFLLVDFPLFANGVVAFLHGGSPCKRFGNPILSEPG
jgi:hypothetical protein